MRLTLRTLLAYLDDILEPADAREIGAKIAESSVAGTMVERIREVMRRRRITAPELTGPGSGPDPNLVAEYLDNTLAPEAVAEIERICLESDIHLAETAGCHQILTIVLGEPVDIHSRTRERMYGLGAIAAPQDHNGGVATREPIPPATADTRRTAAVAAASVQTGDETFSQGVPDYLRRRPLWRRFWPAAAFVAVVVGWLALVLSDPSIRNPTRPKSPVTAAADVPAAEVEAPAVAGVVADAVPAPETTEPVVPDTETAVAVTGDAINPPPPPDLVEPSAPPVAEPVVEPAPVAGDATAAPTPAEPVAEPAPAVAVHAPPITYSSLDGIALRYDQGMNDWTILERQSPVHPGDWIAAPDPFASRLEVAGGQLAIVLNAGSAVQSIAPQEGRLTSLYVDRGRIVLSRPGGDQASPDPIRIGVQVGQQQLDVELLEPGTLVGLEVLLRQPQGKSATPETPAVDGGVFVVGGSAAVQPADGERTLLSAENGWLPWPAADGVWLPGPLLSIPQWVATNGPLPLQSTVANAKLYERLFPLDQPVSVGVPAIVKDTRPKISQFAVATLGLTQNVPQLLRALQAEHDESRQTAIVELRQWLPRAPDNGDILREELARCFRDDEVEPLNELLWGYGPQDLRNLETSTRLIDWLSHDDVAVRELALYHIKTVTNRPTDYHPLAPAVQRQAAIARLQDVVRRYGGLLPPEQ